MTAFYRYGLHIVVKKLEYLELGFGERVKKYMKKKIKYTDEPMEGVKLVHIFFRHLKS